VTTSLFHSHFTPTGWYHLLTSATSLVAFLLVLRPQDTRQPFQTNKFCLQEREKTNRLKWAMGLSSPALAVSQRGQGETQTKSHPRELCLSEGRLSGPSIRNLEARCCAVCRHW